MNLWIVLAAVAYVGAATFFAGLMYGDMDRTTAEKKQFWNTVLPGCIVWPVVIVFFAGCMASVKLREGGRVITDGERMWRDGVKFHVLFKFSKSHRLYFAIAPEENVDED